jgi:hypothetical protein
MVTRSNLWYEPLDTPRTGFEKAILDGPGFYENPFMETAKWEEARLLNEGRRIQNDERRRESEARERIGELFDNNADPTLKDIAKVFGQSGLATPYAAAVREDRYAESAKRSGQRQALSTAISMARNGVPPDEVQRFLVTQGYPGLGGQIPFERLSQQYRTFSPTSDIYRTGADGTPELFRRARREPGGFKGKTLWDPTGTRQVHAATEEERDRLLEQGYTTSQRDEGIMGLIKRRQGERSAERFPDKTQVAPPSGADVVGNAMEALGEIGKAFAPPNSAGVQRRVLKDGRSVLVRPTADGKWETVSR